MYETPVVEYHNDSKIAALNWNFFPTRGYWRTLNYMNILAGLVFGDTTERKKWPNIEMKLTLLCTLFPKPLIRMILRVALNKKLWDNVIKSEIQM